MPNHPLNPTTAYPFYIQQLLIRSAQFNEAHANNPTAQIHSRCLQEQTRRKWRRASHVVWRTDFRRSWGVVGCLETTFRLVFAPRMVPLGGRGGLLAHVDWVSGGKRGVGGGTDVIMLEGYGQTEFCGSRDCTRNSDAAFEEGPRRPSGLPMQYHCGSMQCVPLGMVASAALFVRCHPVWAPP